MGWLWNAKHSVFVQVYRKYYRIFFLIYSFLSPFLYFLMTSNIFDYISSKSIETRKSGIRSSVPRSEHICQSRQISFKVSIRLEKSCRGKAWVTRQMLRDNCISFMTCSQCSLVQIFLTSKQNISLIFWAQAQFYPRLKPYIKRLYEFIELCFRFWLSNEKSGPIILF
jgi:hypothetical protein